MGLVDYSDSETSDVEDAPPSAPGPKQQPAKPTFHKVTDPSVPRKIKVDLPALQPDPSSGQDDGPPTKKARTAGTFSGFNSMLPAPKRPAAQSAPKAGVNLRTSSEAAFSRAPPSVVEEDETYGDLDVQEEPTRQEKVDEPKIVGKATKFKPLSVANSKKKKSIAVTKASSKDEAPDVDSKQTAAKSVIQEIQTPDRPPTTPKRALFSVPQEDQDAVEPSSNDSYEPLIAERHGDSLDISGTTAEPAPSTLADNKDPLQSITADLNLTPAQKRQLFGRHAKSADINIAHFNMENEYAANEQLRQAGEVFQHRAVKAIAPGKHSLQQLVNNARSQQDAMEDKWAEGRRDRGEGGAKYGWSNK